MDYRFWFVAALFFGVIALIDLIGHKKNQVKRKAFDWVFLCLLVGGTILSSGSAIMKLKANNMKDGVTVDYAQASQYSEALIEELLSTRGNEPAVLKMGIRFYSDAQNYDEAEALAESLATEFPTPENIVIYTEAIAQKAYAAGDQESIKRAINLLKTKNNIFTDDEGLYELQLAKLYLFVGNRDKADDCMNELLTDIDKLKVGSVLRTDLINVNNIFSSTAWGAENQTLHDAIIVLINHQLNHVFSADGTGFSAVAAEKLYYLLKYSHEEIRISQISTEEYPKINVVMNINGKKEAKWGSPSEYYADDFTIIDTNKEIKDFKVNSDSSKRGVDVAFVLGLTRDNGSLLQSVKSAVLKAMGAGIDDERYALISCQGSGAELQKLTTDKSKIANTIDGVTISENMSTAGGIMAGINALNDKESMVKVVVAVLDEGSSPTMDEIQAVIEEANKKNVAVYVVQVQETSNEDLSVLNTLAEKTGGIYINAEALLELPDTLSCYQEYLVNKYILTYSVAESDDQKQRWLQTSVQEYGLFTSKEYEATQFSDLSGLPIESDNSTPIPMITGRTPQYISRTSAKIGIEITIQVENMTQLEQVFVGTEELSDLRKNEDNTYTGILKTDLSVGGYDLKAVDRSGNIAVYEDGISIFMSGGMLNE